MINKNENDNSSVDIEVIRTVFNFYFFLYKKILSI